MVLGQNLTAGIPARKEGRNMICKIEGKKLIITLDLLDPYPSSTGKTLIVASSGGAVQGGFLVNGRPAKVNVSAYIPAGGPGGAQTA